MTHANVTQTQTDRNRVAVAQVYWSREIKPTPEIKCDGAFTVIKSSQWQEEQKAVWGEEQQSSKSKYRAESSHSGTGNMQWHNRKSWEQMKKLRVVIWTNLKNFSLLHDIQCRWQLRCSVWEFLSINFFYTCLGLALFIRPTCSMMTFVHIKLTKINLNSVFSNLKYYWIKIIYTKHFFHSWQKTKW